MPNTLPPTPYTRTPSPAPPRVLCVQDGARLHYAIPLALQEAGMLQAMCSEWFVTRGSLEEKICQAISLIHPRTAARLRGRCHEQINPKFVRTNMLLTLRQELARRHMSGQPFYAWSAEQVGNWIAKKHLKHANLLHGFVRNLDPTLCKIARQRGINTLGDQIIAPAAEELTQLKIARQRFPKWERDEALDSLERYVEMEQETWAMLDHITCASEYVRDHLIAQGVLKNRITVLPYPIDPQHFRPVNSAPNADEKITSTQSQKPVTVGFVGAVNLRKGTPYFFQVAKRFDPQRVRFVMVGGVQIDDAIARENKGNVELIGAVPRADVASWFEKFDIYLFPSTCEGSAGSVMEAMASGLPVITSPNSGSLVRDGVEGFIAKYDDIDLLTASVEELVSDVEKRKAMGQAARLRAQTHDIHWYSTQLAIVCRQILA